MTTCNISSNRTFIKQIKSLVKLIKDIPNKKEQKEEYLKELRLIKSQYTDIVSDDNFFESLSKIIEDTDDIQMIIMDDESGQLESVLSHDYRGELSTYDPNYVESTLDIESKFDVIDSTPQEINEKKAIKEHVLQQYFPMSSDARLAFELKFKEDIISRFFFSDIGSPRVNISNSEMDQSIKDFRYELIRFLDNYIRKNYPKFWNVFRQYSIQSKLDAFKLKLLDTEIFQVNPIELIKVPVINLLTDEELKSKLLTYMSYIALSHYDELISLAFGDSVTILHKGNYNTSDIKYKINLGNRSATSWSDESEDVDETELVGSIIRLYMESLDMYKDGEKLPFKMTFSDVKSGFGGIMNLLNSFNLKEKTLNRNIRLELLIGSKVEDSGIKRFYKEGWDTIYSKYIKGKTLGHLIAEAKRDPALLMPLLFTTLAKNSEALFENRYLERQAVESLWENLYNLNNRLSLLNRVINSGGINLDNADLYSFVTTLFVNIENIPVIEYKQESDKTISAIELRLNTSNSRLNSLKFNWAGMYNSEIVQQFKTFSIDEFDKEPQTKVRLKKSDLILKISNGNTTYHYSNGKTISNLESLLNSEVLEFLTEVFGRKIDLDYVDIFKKCGGNLKELLNLAGTILFNYKVGKTVSSNIKNLKSKDKSLRELYDELIKFYYGENSPDIMRDSLLPELITKSVYPAVRRLSLVFDIQSGYSGDTTAKDGSGKQIALKGLSSLMSRYMELAYNHNLADEESILKGFNIYNTFENAYFMRDFSSVETKKLATLFSEAEFFLASLLYDFYGELLAVDDNGVLNDLRKTSSSSNTKFRIMGPVISDKNKLPKLQFDWTSEVIMPDGTTKKYYELTPDDIFIILNKEFGDFYKGVYDRIHKDWDALLPYVQAYIPEAVLDFDNDFELFNLICLTNNINPFTLIHNAIADYQTNARLNGLSDYEIRITDNFHYIKGRDGQIHNNPALFHQLNIYGRGVPFKVRTNNKYLTKLNTETINETPSEARQRLNYQLISELLLHDIRLTFGVKDSNIIDNVTYAAQLYNKKDVWRTGNTIIFAKINGVNLTSLRDFKNWNKYKDLINFYGSNLPEELDINSPKFELGKTLNTINVIHKYRTLLLAAAKQILIPGYTATLELDDFVNALDLIVNDLTKKHPNWKPETIQRKAQEKLDSFNHEQLAEYLANYFIDKDVEAYIEAELKGKEHPDYANNFQYLLNNLETLDAESEDTKKLMSRLDFPGYSMEINPEIERYHSLNNWLGEAYMLTTVGTFISHPGDNNAKTIYNYEYGNFGLLVKRNVSLTATKHREVQNSLKGIRQSLRLLIVEDEKDSAITYKGDYKEDGIEIHNGATWYNGTMVDLDNNSLGADAMGLDKKPFLHAVDPRTGCAFILKTAGFAVNNAHILESFRHRRMNYIMNHTIKWSDTLRKYKYTDPYFNWLLDGNDLNFKNGWYVYKEGKFYKYSNPTIDSNGNTFVTVQEVYSNGEPKNVESFTISFGYINGQFTEMRITPEGLLDFNGNPTTGELKPIDSNWELWNIFGGAYSCHFDNEHKLTYTNDNTSFLMVNYVMNHTGKIVNNFPVYSQSSVIQIIKESQIDMIPTMEAVKFGPTNINTVLIFDDPNYHPTYMEVFSDDFGEQLDAEHTAEGGHVSLMTLVINALGARGYSKLEAEECYQALENLAEQAFEDAFDSLYDINNGINTSLESFKVTIANIILLTLKNTSISDGNILSALALNLRQFQRFENTNQLEGVFPISSPQIYANIFSKFASSLEKASVRLKFDGGMLVLNPSNRIFQIINGEHVGKIPKLEVENLLIESYNNPLTSPSQIKIGRNYYIIGGIGLYFPVLVDSINDFNFVKLEILSGEKRVIEAFLYGLEVTTTGEVVLNEGNVLGRDLATYDCIIKELNSDREYNLYEVDVVQQLFAWDKTMFKNPENREQTKLENYWNRYMLGETEVEPLLLAELENIGIKEINPNMMQSFLYEAFQTTLNSISNGVGNEVVINGEKVKIDKSKTKISPYEAIFPMIYKTSFGLKDGDTVGEIESDKYFFVKRFCENSTSKFVDGDGVDAEEFDFELKRTSGNHIYLAHPDRIILGTPFTPEYEIVGDALYRVDEGKRLYQIPAKTDSMGKLVPNCKIVKTDSGVEIIQTDDFLTILEQGGYNSIAFGDFSDSLDYVENLLLLLEQCSYKVALNKAQYILNAINKKVNINKDGIIRDDKWYSTIINDEKLKEAYLNAPKFNSIAEIFSNEAGLNALTHHELYVLDASNQLKKLRKLENSLYNEIELQKFLEENSYYKHVVEYGKELYVSFLASLLAVVSRTPAQSYQSFMAMKVAGFDSNLINSIYVNRMQLELQGSDYTLK